MIEHLTEAAVKSIPNALMTHSRNGMRRGAGEEKHTERSSGIIGTLLEMRSFQMPEQHGRCVVSIQSGTLGDNFSNIATSSNQ